MRRQTRVLVVVVALLGAPPAAVANPGWVTPAATLSALGNNPAFTTAIASNARGDTAVAWQDPVTNHVWAAERPVGGAFSTGTELSTLSDQALGSVDIDASGNMYVFFVTESMTNAASRPRVAIKALGASTWVVTPLAAADSAHPAFPPITGAVTPGGKAVAIWFQGDTNNATLSKFEFAVKAAGSATWGSKADIPGSTGNSPTNAHVVMNAAGQAAFVFASQNCSGFAIRARGTTMTAANVWATANGLNTCSNNSINLAGGPVVGLDADGTATAAWSRDDAPMGGSGHPIVQFSSKQIDGTTWPTAPASPSAADLSASGADAVSPAVAVTPDGTTTVAWVRNGVIEERTRAALGGGFAGLTVIPNSLTAPTGLLLAAGANNAAAAVWTGTASAKNAIGAATRVAGGSAFTAAPAAPGTDNTAPALAIDDEGNAPGAWVHLSSGQYAVQASGLDAAPPALSGVSFPTAADPGVAFSYTATATDRWSPATAAWTFGDGTTGPGSASKTYATAGDFVATLTAADSFGNSTSEAHPITVGNPPGGGGGPAPDTVAPVFLSARLTNTTFAVDPKGSAEKPVTARARAKKGTTFRYTLSEAARVLFKIQRKAPGRRVGRKCRPPSRSNRRNKKCTRLVTVATFAKDSAAGANTKKFSGKIGKKTLKPGRYQASLTARDAAGNVSAVKTLSFRVVRR